MTNAHREELKTLWRITRNAIDKNLDDMFWLAVYKILPEDAEDVPEVDVQIVEETDNA
jgi:hypothetical protein